MHEFVFFYLFIGSSQLQNYIYVSRTAERIMNSKSVQQSQVSKQVTQFTLTHIENQPLVIDSLRQNNVTLTRLSTCLNKLVISVYPRYEKQLSGRVHVPARCVPDSQKERNSSLLISSLHHFPSLCLSDALIIALGNFCIIFPLSVLSTVTRLLFYFYVSA